MPDPAQQKRIEGRVMHEFKHGELKSGQGGKAGPVKSRKQAIAIALNEAGASRFKSEKDDKKSYAKTRAKEAKGETAEQRKEGREHVSARGQRSSAKSAGGSNARKSTARGGASATSRARKPRNHTVKELRDMARKRGVEGRSRLNKQQLENALGLS